MHLLVNIWVMGSLDIFGQLNKNRLIYNSNIILCIILAIKLVPLKQSYLTYFLNFDLYYIIIQYIASQP